MWKNGLAAFHAPLTFLALSRLDATIDMGGQFHDAIESGVQVIRNQLIFYVVSETHQECVALGSLVPLT